VVAAGNVVDLPEVAGDEVGEDHDGELSEAAEAELVAAEPGAGRALEVGVAAFDGAALVVDAFSFGGAVKGPLPEAGGVAAGPGEVLASAAGVGWVPAAAGAHGGVGEVEEVREVAAAVAASERGALEPGEGGGGSAVQGEGVAGAPVEGAAAGEPVREGALSGARVSWRSAVAVTVEWGQPSRTG